LNLSYNNLKHAKNIVSSFQKLYIANLDLSSNMLESLNFSFNNLEHLKYLYLKNNQINLFEKEAFSGLKLLLGLDISNNRLPLIERTTFKTLNSLDYLNVSSNFIQYIYQDQFSSLVNLVDLDMSNNTIEYFDSKTFSDLISLENLCIHMNRLKTIDKLDGLSSIRNIYLDISLLLENFTNVVNLRNSIQVKLHKESRNIIYLKSVNVITYPHIVTNDSVNEYCIVSMFFIKYNISFNLKTDEDFDSTTSNCEKICLLKFNSMEIFVEN
jgi:Leucine-rich repeat (LRR) protein